MDKSRSNQRRISLLSMTGLEPVNQCGGGEKVWVSGSRPVMKS